MRNVGIRTDVAQYREQIGHSGNSALIGLLLHSPEAVAQAGLTGLAK
jgi:hypothetical protein